MSATPAGYEAFHSLRRKGVTFLCLVMVSTITMGILVYVDSYSVHRWDDYVNSVPVSMIVEGPMVYERDYAIAQIEGVTKAAGIRKSWAMLGLLQGGEEYRNWGITTAALDEDTIDKFPFVLSIVQGQLPSNQSEIALSSMVADWIGIGVGSKVNYSTYEDRELKWWVLTVVGIFEVQNKYGAYGWYGFADAIVDEALINTEENNGMLLIDLDKSKLSPFNVDTSIAYLRKVETRIMTEIDPAYNPSQPWNSNYWNQNLLLAAVYRYSAWLTALRITEVVRNSGIMLMGALTIVLAIRFNIHDRRYESQMLIARGASESSVQFMILREVFVLSVLATVVGLGGGCALSRIGMASQGFFQLNLAALSSEPFLVSVQSILIATIIGLILPMLSIIGYLAFMSLRERAEAPTGKLAKLGRALNLVRWDVLVIILTTLLLFAIYNAGTRLIMNPLLTFFAYLALTFAPLALFAATTSLYTKAIRRGSSKISSYLKGVFGVIPSSVGVRRVGKSASSAALVTMVVVLAISTAWTTTIVSASLPATKQAQARMVFGSDLTFHLRLDSWQNWTDFEKNISKYDGVEATSLVPIKTMSMSLYGNIISFVGVDPQEFVQVGYDYLGRPLNESFLGDYVSTLASQPAGAIVTESIAQEYGLTVGDVIRASASDTNGNITVAVLSVIGIAPALPPTYMVETGTELNSWQYVYEMVGSDVIWTSRQYMDSLFNKSSYDICSLCVRLSPNTNGTALGERALNESHGILVQSTPYSSVTRELEYYIRKSDFTIDRAVDTIAVLGSTTVILAAFLLYASEDMRSRKREIALMRAMGASQNQVEKTQIAEMMMLVIGSVLFLLLFAPLFISNALYTTRASVYLFPFTTIITVPWPMVGGILALFVLSTTLFAIVVARLSVRINLAQALNAAWTEAGPLGGEL
ncbi:MAG: ABC transporter permease [Candidatus Thorarchaeota archaeon]